MLQCGINVLAATPLHNPNDPAHTAAEAFAVRVAADYSMRTGRAEGLKIGIRVAPAQKLGHAAVRDGRMLLDGQMMGDAVSRARRTRFPARMGRLVLDVTFGVDAVASKVNAVAVDRRREV